MKKINPVVIDKVKSFLDYDGYAFFLMCKEEYRTVSPTWVEGKGRNKTTHSVQLREGMEVKNFMRGLGLLNDWTDKDFDKGWIKAIEIILEDMDKEPIPENLMPKEKIQKTLPKIIKIEDRMDD
jgi:hypothetical protein